MASLAVGFACGFVIWWASPSLLGHDEPWDGVAGGYPLALLLSGFVATLLYPRNCVYAVLGVYLGQAFYAGFIYAPGGPAIFPAFLAVAIFGVVPAAIGGLTAMGVANLRRRLGSPNG